MHTTKDITIPEEATAAPTAEQPVPTALDFPIAWEDPNDAKLTWTLNTSYEEPIPLLVDALVTTFLEGGNSTFEQVALPFRVRFKRINTYQYMGLVPTDAPPEVVMKGMGLLSRAAPGMFKRVMKKVGDGMSKESEAVLDPIIARFDSYWNDEVLPEIKQHLAYFESCDVRGLSPDQLRAHLAEAFKRLARMGALHGVIVPMLYAMSQFEEFYCEIFPGSTTLDALRLTQGLENKTIEGDRALWRLSRAALSVPSVAKILREEEVDAVIPALEASAEGRQFLAELRTWLAHYGQRLNTAFAFVEPSWIDDPTPAIRNLQAYVAQAEARPEMDPASLSDEREQATAEARARIAAYPQPVIDRFEMLLKAAQTATVIHEDHNFWIDQRFNYHLQQLLLEFGRRYVQAGVLETTSDVFHLTVNELLDDHDISLKQLVQKRKATLAHFSQVAPPPMLGTPPPFDMSDAGSVLRAIMKGEISQTSDSRPEANMVKGLAGSAGVTRGTARVLRSLADAGKLQPGDVLVAVATEPPWTPLFATASAVVTDNGGVLSHTAVVAREYRIPAVVGTGLATSTFTDGQLLEVDGDAGTVRVVVEEEEHEPALVG